MPIKYKNDPTSSVDASDLEDFVLKYCSLIWIQGHIHEPIQYKIEKTEVICKPYGYLDRPSTDYIKEFIRTI
ncbi:MAG: hypothetical protein HRT67_10935 [Flavobacteriaceae bacterium]|nr:hypothetical protein [Flavobacteriaceae bacterium]